MAVRVSLDGSILANTPKGWDEAKIKTKRDSVVKGLFLSYTTDLEFWGDGFSYIDSVMDSNYCQSIDVLIESDDCNAGEWEQEYVGVIQLTQISKYDVTRRIIKTKVFDTSYNAKIDNNKSIKAFVDVGTSKNGDVIDVVTSHEILFFNPSDIFPTYLVDPRNGYKIFDCFRFIIDYMSDGTVDFKSDIFEGEYNDWMLFNGKEVRLGVGDGLQLEVSFKDLFRELDKKTNLSFAIEPNDPGEANPYRLRLEPTDFFEQDSADVTLENIDGILMSFNKDQLYSNIDIGSKTFEDDVFSTTYPPLNFKAFKEENYTILGDCNIDKTLNLLSSYIIDTNVIEDSIINNEDRYDKKVFIVITDGLNAVKYKEYDDPLKEGFNVVYSPFQLTNSGFPLAGVQVNDMAVNMTTGATTSVTIVTTNVLTLVDDIFSLNDDFQIRTAPYNYNHPLTNVEVVTRFLGGIPNSVVKYIGSGGVANFQAEKTDIEYGVSYPYSKSPVEFDNDSTLPNFDDGNNYDNTTFEYTIPASGLYGFSALSDILLYNYSKDIILNGNFTLGANRQQHWDQNTASIYFGIAYFYNVNEGYWVQFGATPTNYLRQQVVINPRTHYTVRFKAKYTNDVNSNVGMNPFNISVNGSYQVNVNTPDWAEYEIRLDYSQNTSPPQYIEFRFHGPGTQPALRNIRVLEQQTIQIDQNIKRSSPSGGAEQVFSHQSIIPMDSNTFQRPFEMLSENTFSAFINEKISVDLSMTILSGNTVSQARIQSGGVFKTVLTDDGGGGILPQDPTDAPIYKYTFEKAMSRQDFEVLRDNPEQAVLFSSTETNHIFGWRNSIEWERKTGVAKFELRSKTKIKSDC